MDKRVFLQSLLGAVGLAGTARAIEENKVVAGGMDFRWKHVDERLFCSLSAKTDGWIAVGFNDVKGLKNTRFVIASIQDELRIEEHIALVPDHKSVEDLGLASGLQDTKGQFAYGTSLVEFSLPISFVDRPSLSLAAGAEPYLMLAWSHEASFDHHSAWRKHFSITL